MWLSLLASGAIGSVFALAGLMSVYCRLTEIASLICKFYHSREARIIV